jgi:hypothetical protein
MSHTSIPLIFDGFVLLLLLLLDFAVVEGADVVVGVPPLPLLVLALLLLLALVIVLSPAAESTAFFPFFTLFTNSASS